MKDLEEIIGGTGIESMEDALDPKPVAEEVKETAQEEEKEPEEIEVIPSMEDMKEELEKTFRRIYVGDVLTGQVIDVNEKGVLIDFDYYAPGRIPAEDMSADPAFNILTDVAVGDTVSATVVRLDDGAGNLLLSRKEADSILAWEKLQTMMEEKTVIHGTIKEVVPAGAILYVEGIRGFIPASKLDLQYVENTEEFLNREIDAQVINVDEEADKLVLSAKELLNAKAFEERSRKAGLIEVGTIVEGTVEQLKDYGAFVDIGDGVSGLLHVSQITEKRIKHPKVVLSVGQKVRVKITKVENGKISLSMKELNDVTSREVEEQPFDYQETGAATTGLGALLAGFKFD